MFFKISKNYAQMCHSGPSTTIMWPFSGSFPRAPKC